MAISTNYLRLNNELDSQEDSQRNKSFKSVKDWSVDVQCSGNTYDGIRVFARESSITVVALVNKTFFSFNVTYAEQAQKACELFLETVKKYSGSVDSVKLWKILPYKELYTVPLELIDIWIADTFPEANVESKTLQKGYCFFIERENGDGIQKYEPESLYKKTVRSVSKCCSILSRSESKSLSSQCK
ncbi:MAG: hypothetical protein LBC45_04925 [Chlamydiales bacterium]|jgi:hypothetical protein|nr:hypothetical protein [Chlamydiales bacterium]